MSTIFFGGPIYGHPEAEAVLVKGDSIAYIGTLGDCAHLGTATIRKIDLQSRILLPAFTDAHAHFVEYSKSRLLVSLSECNTIAEIRDRLIRYRAELTWDAKWILGGGWNRNILDEPMRLNRHLIDEVFPDIPVALFSRDYHAKLLNTKALQITGISEDCPDPEGGRFERMPGGSLSGVLFETATELVDRHVIHPPDEVIVNSIHESLPQVYRWGLIGFHSLEYKASKDLLLQAQKEGELFRLCWHFQASELDEMIAGKMRSYEGDEFFKVGGLKLFGDGSLGSRTGAMFEPYANDDGNCGILRYRDEELFAQMQKAARAGFASTIHAIGDRAARQIIDATLKLNENPAYRGLLHRIEHVQSIRLSDIPDLKKSGLFVSLQPVHIANDIPLIHKSWPHVEHQAYAFRSMLDAGIAYGFGSDAPIETMNPFHGIYSALQRRHKLDPKGEQFNAAEAIAVREAIDGYSIGAAMASSSAGIRGKIQRGYLADLIVIDDYRGQPDEFWLEARSHFTMIGGKAVLDEL